jgi:cellulose synthase/poly-beta-1,6-N-acetylglucosamine synthase-like glycosyltransferase
MDHFSAVALGNLTSGTRGEPDDTDAPHNTSLATCIDFCDGRRAMSRSVAETRNSPLVSIVLVNYNSGTSLMNCVTSVAKSAYPNKELIIVDNASNDNSISMLDTLGVEARILQNPMNLGFSRARNAGIAEAKAQFVAVKNPDTIVDPSWLDSLVETPALWHVRKLW